MPIQSSLAKCYKYFFLVFIIFLLLGFFFYINFYRQSLTQAQALSRHFPPGVHEVLIPPLNGVRTHLLNNISILVEKSIKEGKYPGAVILAGHRGHIIYQGVFGNRRILPNVAPMRFDTLFDLASLTKVIATAPAIMLLIEEGKLKLDSPVKNYWPAFAQHGKEAITVRELLTHTSGLPADLPGPLNQSNLFAYLWHGELAALNEIATLKLQTKPGTRFVYSDVNFIILAYLVEIITKERFDYYVQNHIFKPLNMKNTLFLPPANLRDRIAPTEMIDNQLRWGKVHDPTADAMRGVSGNAGLFSDAHDLSIYAQWILDKGHIPYAAPESYLLGPLTILKMTTPQSTSAISEIRGLGWDIDSAFSCHGDLMSTASFGHTGWTGTSIWIDPVIQTWVIILTSRTHPTPAKSNKLLYDRNAIANIVAASII